MEATLNLLLLEDVGSDAELVEHELRRSGFQLNSRRVESREDFLRELTDETRTALILVTHSEEAAAICQNRIHLRDGRIVART